MPTSDTSRVVLILASTASVHTWRWAVDLRAAGWDVHLLTRDREEPHDYSGIPVHRFWMSSKAGYIPCAVQARRLAQKIEAGLMHAFYASEYGLTAALSGFRPVLLSVIGSDVLDYPEKSPLHKAYIRWILRRCGNIASTSKVMARRVEEITKGISPVVTPFGVDIEQFFPAPKPVLSGPVVRIGSVRHLHPTYGIDLLIHAFSKLQTRLADRRFELVIAGSGPQLGRLKTLVSNHGLQGSVTFSGKLMPEALPGFLRELDICVVPSRRESFGVAAIEASAVGLPVVASDTGGLPEAVMHEKTGLLFKSGDINALTEQLIRLVDNPETARKYGQNGREFVEARFSREICTHKMSELYRGLV